MSSGQSNPKLQKRVRLVLFMGRLISVSVSLGVLGYFYHIGRPWLGILLIPTAYILYWMQSKHIEAMRYNRRRQIK